MKRGKPSLDELRLAVCSWLGKRIVVVGDAILDEFIYGRTNRVSREAPVVIVHYEGSNWACGGAANAARNVKSLGGNCSLVSLAGCDEGGMRLLGILRDEGIKVSGIVKSRNIATTIKTRIMAGDYHAQFQQVLRIDRDPGKGMDKRLEGKLLAVIKREISRADAVLLSDYDQGIFTDRVIDSSLKFCRSQGVPVVADSRYRLASFRRVTVATPNEVEAATAARVEAGADIPLEQIGRKLLGSMKAGAVLVTRGRFGMALFEPGRRTKCIDVVGSKEATDVTGAGDTVAAAMALAVAAGCDMTTAMHLANIAASIVVMKRGTAVATVSELLAAIDAQDRCERESYR